MRSVFNNLRKKLASHQSYRQALKNMQALYVGYSVNFFFFVLIWASEKKREKGKLIDQRLLVFIQIPLRNGKGACGL